MLSLKVSLHFPSNPLDFMKMSQEFVITLNVDGKAHSSRALCPQLPQTLKFLPNVNQRLSYFHPGEY